MEGIPGDRVVSAEEAIHLIRNGDRVFIASGAAEPRHIVATLAEAYRHFADVEILHLLASGPPPFADERFRDHFRYNSFFVGDVVAPAMRTCLVDYTPLPLSELPLLLRTRRYPIDVALVSVTPPDADGLLGIGPSIDVCLEAIEGARYVVAQVNEALPQTTGGARIDPAAIDAFVVRTELPPEVHRPPPPWVGPAIGRFAAELVEDGDVLHVSDDPLSCAILPFLRDRRDLGVHTDVFTDALADLVVRGVITNARNAVRPGQSVATVILGTRRLYDFVRESDAVALLPTATVCDRALMARHPRMIAVRSALGADITGNVLLDAAGSPTYRGVGADIDFLRGAAASGRGFPVLLMASADEESGRPNIVSRFDRWAGSVMERATVHYVCTEYGFAHLHARTLRERVLAMIAIAHPRHRERLMEEAKELGYVPADQIVTPYPGCLYPNEQVTRHRFGDEEVFFRPVHPSDEREIQRFFYSHSPETVFHRYHGTIKTMHHAKVQQLTNIDYRLDVAIVGLVGVRGSRRIVCEARCLDYGRGRGEVSLTIAEDWHGRGLGTFLLRYLTAIARQRGLRRVTAQIVHSNRAALRLFTRVWPTARHHLDGAIYTFDLALQPGVGENVEARGRDHVVV